MDPTQSLTESTPHLPYEFSPASITIVAVACSLGIFYFFVFTQRVATNATKYALTEEALKNPSKAREEWITQAKELLGKGMAKMKRSLVIRTPTGQIVYLPNTLAHEIRNMKELDFPTGVAHDFMATYPGLSPFQMITNNDIVQEVARLNLTRSLDLITDDMNSEITAALTKLLGNIPDWKTIDLKPFVYRLVARASTRVFLGPEVAKNEEWLDIAVSFTTNSFAGVYKLRNTHPLLRRAAQWFIPELALCRQQVARSRAIINPYVQDRLSRKAKGENTEKAADMISWIDDRAKAKGVKADHAEIQLTLAMAALHTTTETISYLISDLLENEKWIPKIREEMATNLATHGWKKTSLASMALLDSTMKESQRLSRLTDLGMIREAVADVTLSDGTFIPKGYRVGIETKFEDPNTFTNPTKFEADRFMKLRETDRSKWHFVTGSPEHLGFGFGRHTCPGRFFASNEIKIAMTHLLLNYEWKFPEGGRLPTVSHGPDMACNPGQKVLVRSRVPEIDLTTL